MYSSRRIFLASIVASIFVICALGSPIALEQFRQWTELDWSELADVGETYGAASAIFSAVAVVGVAASLLYQAQQLRLARLQHVRGVQRELLAKIMDDPSLGEVIGLHRSGESIMTYRERAFILAWIQYLNLLYEGGVASEKMFKGEVLPAIFRSDMVRRFWETARSHWLSSSATKSEHSFAKLMDAGYQESLRSDPVIAMQRATPAERGQPNPSMTVHASVAVAIAAVTVAATAGWLAGRRRKQP